MAKVLVSFFSGIDSDAIPAYYEGFLHALYVEGNEVLYLKTNDFLSRPWDGKNELDFFIKKKKLKEEILKFSPDVVFAYNNSCLPLDFFPEEQVICIMEADTHLYYNDREKIKKNPNRFKFFSSTESSLKNIPEIFGVDKKNSHRLNLATGVKSQDIPKTNNISFIGSSFGSHNFINNIGNITPPSRIKDITNVFEHLKKIDNPQIIKKYHSFFSYHFRCSVLDEVSHLGLVLYGKDWTIFDQKFPRLHQFSNSKHVFSLRHNQDIYNSSFICLNINHTQALEAIPWRVLDILASNGCLVSCHSKVLSEFLDGYIDIPTFGSKEEAYSICSRLLKDSIYRNEIVEASQQAINDKGRWSHRLLEIEQEIGIQLTAIKNDTRDLGELCVGRFTNPYKNNMYRLLLNAIVLLVSNLPIKLCAFFYKCMKFSGFCLPQKLIDEIAFKLKK